MKVKIQIKDGVQIPKYESDLASGMDVRVFASEITDIKQINNDTRDVSYAVVNGIRGFYMPPLSRVIVPSGIKVAIPKGYEIQVRSRSGVSLKQGLIVVQGIGTIDADYRGEIGICLANISNSNQFISFGERICQIVLSKVDKVDWVISDDLNKTERGSGGFGSTGKK